MWSRDEHSCVTNIADWQIGTEAQCDMQAHPILSSPVGQPVNQYELRGLIEQLTQQLFKLDNVEGGGEIRTARKSQIARIESLADALERLKS